MKLGSYILTVIFSVLCSFVSNGQNNTIDSLKNVLQTQKGDTNKINTLNKISEGLNQVGDYKNALVYANQALSLSEDIGFTIGKAHSYSQIGGIYYRQNNFSEALKNFSEALKTFEKVKNKAELAQSYSYIAYTYLNMQNYPEALNNAYSALKLFEELDDKRGTFLTLNNIGLINLDQSNYSEALKNFQTSLELQEEIGEKSQIANTYLSIGEIYFKQGKYAEALNVYSSALKIFKEFGWWKWGIAMSHTGIGTIYQKQGEIASSNGDNQTASSKYADALNSYTSALEIWEKEERKDGISDSYYNLGNLYIKLGKYAIAKDYMEKSLALSVSIDNIGGMKDCYRSFSTLDSINGNYKQAYEHYKMYISYRDSVSNEESKKKLVQTTMQYEFDKKESLAKAEQSKKDEATRRTRNLQYFVIAIVLVAAIFLFIYSRQKQKAKTKMEKAYSDLKATQQQLIQSEKMASLGELTAGIAHEIQNPLNFVNNFSDVNKELIEELNAERLKANAERNIQIENEILNDIKENEQKINHHGKRADAIVKGMLQHSRTSTGQKEPTDINALADEYLRLSFHGMRAKDKSFNATTKTEFDNNIGKIKVNPQDMGRVVLNLINNAFYAVNEKAKQNIAGYEPTVTVSTKKEKNKVEIRVKDNGNGIPQKILDKIFQPFFTTKPTGQGTGLGLSLAYDIVTKGHGGELKVETKEGEGSEFVIQLPG